MRSAKAYIRIMKHLFFYIMVITGSILLLSGCNIDKSTDGQTSKDIAEESNLTETEEKSGVEDDNSAGENNNKEEGKMVTGDNPAIALEFAKDLIDGNFDDLLQNYSYDTKMKKAMSTQDTKKLILFYNAEYGKMEEIKTPYSMSYGTYQSVMVPVVSSLKNYNYQITFDNKQNIVGFTYESFLEKDSSKDKKIPSSVVETEYTFECDGFVIPGTLTAPKKGNNLPVVILVQGSGPSDRDESIYENKPFRDIAWALAEKGIASFRYDKRTYLFGEKIQKDTSFTIYDETIDDTVAAAQMIKNLKNINSAKVYVLGHSLGGYVIPRIAKKLPEAAGFIMMSAPAEHMKEYLLDQIKFLANEDGKVTAKEQESFGTINKQIELLNQPENIPENKIILGAYKAYWIDLKQYNAMEQAEHITTPVLVLQGERDYQVTMEQYNLWKGAFESYSNWTFHSYPALNHLMMEGKGAPNSAEYKTKAYVDEQVLTDIIKFINK